MGPVLPGRTGSLPVNKVRHESRDSRIVPEVPRDIGKRGRWDGHQGPEVVGPIPGLETVRLVEGLLVLRPSAPLDSTRWTRVGGQEPRGCLRRDVVPSEDPTNLLLCPKRNSPITSLKQGSSPETLRKSRTTPSRPENLVEEGPSPGPTSTVREVHHVQLGRCTTTVRLS